MKDEPLSQLGFGMLRIDAENPEHRAALAAAFAEGVSLFDLGDFEGDPTAFQTRIDVLRTLRRDALAARAASAPLPIRFVVRGALGAAAKFGTRFANLHGGANDPIEWIYLVADPEFSLSALEWDHARLYTRLGEELDRLEAFARAGRIGGYGVASAGLTYAKEDPEALALEPLILDRAERRPHFTWLEFPFNLYESEAATEANQLVGPVHGTLLDAARAAGLRTIARRPLDAMTEGGLRRLVAYPDHHRIDLDLAVRGTLEAALVAEVETLARPNHTKTQAGADPATLAPLWAHRLRDQLRHVRDPEQWKEILRRRIEPDLKSLPIAEKSATYFTAMEALLMAVRLWCEKAAAERNERIRARIVEATPFLGQHRRADDRDLAVLAMRIYRSVPGLDYVLAGMRNARYVHAFAKTGARLPAADVRAALVAAHAAIHETLETPPETTP